MAAYKLKDFKSALTDWTCKYCGKGQLVYDVKTFVSEHNASCKKYQKANKTK